MISLATGGQCDSARTGLQGRMFGAPAVSSCNNSIPTLIKRSGIRIATFLHTRLERFVQKPRGRQPRSAYRRPYYSHLGTSDGVSCVADHGLRTIVPHHGLFGEKSRMTLPAINHDAKAWDQIEQQVQEFACRVVIQFVPST